MFNLVKWAFKLGQQTERHRIANILDQQFRYESYKHIPRDVDEAFHRAVHDKVTFIINNITQTSSFEEKRYSLLFPEDK